MLQVKFHKIHCFYYHFISFYKQKHQRLNVLNIKDSNFHMTKFYPRSDKISEIQLRNYHICSAPLMYACAKSKAQFPRDEAHITGA